MYSEYQEHLPRVVKAPNYCTTSEVGFLENLLSLRGCLACLQLDIWYSNWNALGHIAATPSSWHGHNIQQVVPFELVAIKIG